MTQAFHKILIGLICFIFATGCKKEFDTPPVALANDGARINIAQIKAKYYTNINYKFKNDSNLYCVVIADEVSGNLYKEIYVRDVSGAIKVKLKNAGGFYTGDSIRINLKGIYLNEYNRHIQLDSVDKEKSVVKLASGLSPQPLTTTLEQINLNTTATNTLQSQLVRLNTVEFIEGDRNQTFADAVGLQSKNLVIRSCSNQTLTVRTSGYANFASAKSPAGNGQLIAIVSQFGDENGDMQLLLRNSTELNMSGVSCTPTVSANYLSKDFNDNSISSGGWSNVNVNGNINWSTSTQGGAANPYGRISNFISGANQTCETWLISPAINLSAASNPVLSFRNAFNYSGDPLEVYASTNYTSGNPSTATWTKLNFTLSGGNWAFVNSGNVNLSAYKTGTTKIGFKYTGTNNSGSTWEIDEVLVKEN